MNVLIPPVSRVIALAGAALLIVASASLGALYAYRIGVHSHVALGVLLAAAALGGELLKPLAVVSAFEAMRAGAYMRGLAPALLGFVCFTYSLSAALSLAAGSRGDMAATRRAEATAGEAALQAVQRAQAELSQLAPSRPTGELEPLILGLKQQPGANGCVKIDGPVSRRACAEAAVLETELGRARRRTELEAAIARGAEGLTRQRATMHADPLAAALASYAGAIGKRWTAESLTPWLALIPVFFLEFGSALALLVSRGVGLEAAPAQRMMAQEPLPPEADEPPSITSEAEDELTDGEPQGDGVEPISPAHAEMLRRLRQNGGTVQGSQRGLARALGTSKSTVHRSLHELAQAGLVNVSTSPAGTVVALA